MWTDQLGAEEESCVTHPTPRVAIDSSGNHVRLNEPEPAAQNTAFQPLAEITGSRTGHGAGSTHSRDRGSAGGGGGVGGERRVRRA